MARQSPAPALTYPVLALPRWRFELQAVHDGDTLWIPLAGFCALLGVSAQMQRKRLVEDAEFREELRQLPIMTTKGVREGWCIAETALSGWLFTIDSSRVKPAIRADMRAFRKAMIVAAHDLAFKGYVSGGLGSAVAQRSVTVADHAGTILPIPASARLRDAESFALFLEAQVQEMQVDLQTIFDLLRRRGLLVTDDDDDNDGDAQ